MKKKITGKMQTKVSLTRLSHGQIFSLVLVLVGVTIGGITLLKGSHAGSYATPFASGSFWNTQLPASTPVDTVNGAAYLAELRADLQAYSGNGDINTNQYTPPIYTVGTDIAPTVFKFNDCQNKGYTPSDLMSQLVNVPVPANAAPSAGTDEEMVIYQPSTDTVWETWGTQHRGDGWYACWGGRIIGVSTSDGIFPPYFGVTASGLAMLGGTIRASELQAGVINHVVGISMIRTGTGNVWPADRSDGYVAGNPPEGTRFRLDPSINVDSLRLTKTATAIAKAAQIYGLVLWDTSGVAGFRAENAIGFTSQGLTDPYTALFGSTPSYNQLQGFPWASLQVLPPGYGQNGLGTSTPGVTPTPGQSPTPGQISPSSNLVTGKTFTSSAADADSSHVTAYVNDGNESTRWISVPQDNVTLSTDLGASYDLKKVSILWAGDTVKNYQIQTSANNSNWITVATGATNNTSPLLIDTTTFSPAATGRYLRIVAIDRWNTTYGNSIWEIGAYGTSAASPSSTPSPAPSPSPTPGSKSADMTGDGHVNIFDLSYLLSKWGTNDTKADLNSSGNVDIFDLSNLLSQWTG
jgi:hypothetical protein